jgi:ATP synthase protein I
MMTTTTPGPLALAAGVTTVVGVLMVVLGGLTGGEPAAGGAFVGTALALLVFCFGAFAVDAVARLMPVASLLVAMLTYTMQVLLMLLVFVGLNRSGLLDDTLDREWLGGAIIVAVLTWTFAHLGAAANARIPAFDLRGATDGEQSVNAPSEGVRPAAEGGAR